MPQLALYDTMQRAKMPFVPLDPSWVRMYVCGPTVYDYAHIGNARPAVVFDVLYRVLRKLAADGAWDGGEGRTRVTYVRNLTDVDDKINARAAAEHPGMPLNEAIREVTSRTAARYQADVAALGCLPPDHEPRATEFVTPRADGLPDMVGMVSKLVEKGHAYVDGGEVLFDVSSMPAYGGLSRRGSQSLRAGARVAVEGHKRNPVDFVLWKASWEGEPGWDSPWGRGRPGWHIECSAMSAAHLGPVFDIHGGGEPAGRRGATEQEGSGGGVALEDRARKGHRADLSAGPTGQAAEAPEPSAGCRSCVGQPARADRRELGGWPSCAKPACVSH